MIDNNGNFVPFVKGQVPHKRVYRRGTGTGERRSTKGRKNPHRTKWNRERWASLTPEEREREVERVRHMSDEYWDTLPPEIEIARRKHNSAKAKEMWKARLPEQVREITLKKQKTILDKKQAELEEYERQSDAI